MADEYHGLGPPGVIRTAAAKAAKSIRFRTAPESGLGIKLSVPT
jgi:hypothetical protein